MLYLWKYNTDDEAIELVNKTSCGLESAVFTRGEKRAKWFSENVGAGCVGECKGSGYGRECAEQGIKEFANIKTIVIAQ